MTNEELIMVYKLRNKLDVCIILLVGGGLITFMVTIVLLIVTKQ